MKVKLFETYNEDTRFKEPNIKSNVISNLQTLGINLHTITINSDLTVDSNDVLSISDQQLIYIPVQFAINFGYFACEKNDITNLKGTPHTIDGSFYCGDCLKLKDLEYCPIFLIKSNFYYKLSHNQPRVYLEILQTLFYPLIYHYQL